MREARRRRLAPYMEPKLGAIKRGGSPLWIPVSFWPSSAANHRRAAGFDPRR